MRPGPLTYSNNFVLFLFRNAYGVSAHEKKPQMRHMAVQYNVPTKDQELQTSVDVNDTATLTDVSNTTGTQPADAQTDLSAFNTTEVQTQHGPSYSEFADANTGTEKTGIDSNADAIYDLSYFAEEKHSKCPAQHHRILFMKGFSKNDNNSQPIRSPNASHSCMCCCF